MLVDDEPLIVEGMKNIIEWDALGFEVVSTAKNGKEAFEKLQQTQVDVLITDLQMPERSGLELIEAVKEENDQIKTLVLTGFQEFELIKKGLSLGIENYLLKPIDEDELVSSLLHIKDKLNRASLDEQSHLVLRDHAVWRWITGKMENEEFESRISLYPSIQVKPQFWLCLIKAEWEEKGGDYLHSLQLQFERETRAIAVVTPSGDVLLLWSHVQSEEDWKHDYDMMVNIVEERGEEGEFIFASSDKMSDVCEIPKAYRELEKTCELKMLLPKKDHQMADQLYSGKVTHQSSNYLRPDMLEQLANHQYSDVKATIEKALTHFDQRNQPLMMKSILLELFYHVKNHFFIPLEYETYVKMVHQIMSIDTMKEGMDVLDRCIELIEYVPVQKSQQKSPIIETVLHYIHQNYAEDMSLKTLGHQFHVNSIYLGQLFQKEIKCSFTKYLNKIRIDRSKQLLQNSYEKAGKIGKKVGYADATYFYKQFKKLEKVTPTEWRHQNK